jgi:hypothetical protein
MENFGSVKILVEKPIVLGDNKYKLEINFPTEECYLTFIEQLKSVKISWIKQEYLASIVNRIVSGGKQ